MLDDLIDGVNAIQDTTPISGVTNVGGNILRAVDLHRGEADVNRELDAIATATSQVQTHAHFSRTWRSKEVSEMTLVRASTAVRHEFLNGLSDKFFRGVPEQHGDGGTGQHHAKTCVDYKHSVGASGKYLSEETIAVQSRARN